MIDKDLHGVAENWHQILAKATWLSYTWPTPAKATWLLITLKS